MSYRTLNSKVSTVKVASSRLVSNESSKVDLRARLVGDDGAVHYVTVFTGDGEAFIECLKAGELDVNITQQLNEDTNQISDSATFEAPASTDTVSFERELAKIRSTNAPAE